jgi:hypothetical protein
MTGITEWLEALNYSPTICTTTPRLQLLAASFAFAAAVLWFCSCLVKVPEIGDDNLIDENMHTLFFSLRRQGRLNAYAALCAGFAALVQTILVFGPTCIAGSVF